MHGRRLSAFGILAVATAILAACTNVSVSGSGSPSSTPSGASTPSDAAPRINVIEEAPTVIAPTVILPPPPHSYSASITGTCDQHGKCYGVKQRIAPKNDAPQLVAVVLDEGAPVTITCITKGDLRIETDHAPSNLWYRLANGAYINSIYITPPGGDVPRCG